MPSVASNALTCWLTAPCVTHSSSAARVKLSLRAAASKALRAFSGGRRRSMTCVLIEKLGYDRHNVGYRQGNTCLYAQDPLHFSNGSRSTGGGCVQSSIEYLMI